VYRLTFCSPFPREELNFVKVARIASAFVSTSDSEQFGCLPPLRVQALQKRIATRRWPGAGKMPAPSYVYHFVNGLSRRTSVLRKLLTAAPKNRAKNPSRYEPDDEGEDRNFNHVYQREVLRVAPADHKRFHNHEQHVERKRPAKNADFPDVARLAFGRLFVGGGDHGFIKSF
jgi:hypothetical protein